MWAEWKLLSSLLLIASTNCLPYQDFSSQHLLQQVDTSGYEQQEGRYEQQVGSFQHQAGSFEQQAGSFAQQAGSFEQQAGGFQQHAGDFEQQAGNFDYPGHFSESFPIPNEVGFSISCQGQDRLCVKKHLCQNGFVNPYHVGFIQPNQGLQQCDVHKEVCCTLAKYEPHTDTSSQAESTLELKPNEENIEEQQPELQSDAGGAFFESVGQAAVDDQEKFKQIPQSGGASGSVPIAVGTESNSGFVTFAPPVQTGCAAALLCVDERFCKLDGTISQEPLVLSEQQLLRRVPLSVCKNKDNGAIGRCCRDPNYVDPWPTGNLPANYTGGFDEQGFPTFLNIAKVKPPKTPERLTPRPPVVGEESKPTVTHPPQRVTDDTNVVPQFLLPPNKVAIHVNNLKDAVNDTGVIRNEYIEESSNQAAKTELNCGVMNTVSRQPGVADSITTFGEIPWQAMVLHSPERKILCSGAMIGASTILTAANCVNNLAPSELSIKLGEWKLGYELKHEEPLPFEILNVNSINIHPEYRNGYSGHDLALLSLDETAKYDYHVSPLCLPAVENIAQESRQCIVTGWGKQILQAHYAGAVMHAVKMDVLSRENCENRLLSNEYPTNIAQHAICAKTTTERNNVCEADVGGPLACDNGNGFYELVGVYSQDNGCQTTNQVAVFAPVDMTWITTTMESFQQPLQKIPAVEVLTPDFTAVDSTNYRESNYTANNQYLPPE